MLVMHSQMNAMMEKQDAGLNKLQASLMFCGGKRALLHTFVDCGLWIVLVLVLNLGRCSVAGMACPGNLSPCGEEDRPTPSHLQ
jgi:hypothetical protein